MVDWPVPTLDCEADIPEADKATYVGMAVDWLRAATGSVYGLVTTVLRPCYPDTLGYTPPAFWGSAPRTWPRWGVVNVGSDWSPLRCGQCSGACSCRVPGLQLPGPVSSVTGVKLDGAVFTEWALVGDTLTRTDGQPWPGHQDMLAESTQPDTWEVTYVRGVAVPYGGQVAAGVLACEMWRAATNASKCRLPQGLQTLTRQGVSMTVAAAQVDGNATGIWLIDGWVQSVQQRSSVRSPDYNYRGRR